MSTQTGKAVVTYQFNNSAESVYDAWINQDKVMKWMFPNGNILRAEIDARVGGEFSFVDLREGNEVDHRGEYLTLNSPNHLVFTWGIPKEAPEFDRVIIDIVPTENGCELTLVHELHPEWFAYTEQSEKAWRIMLKAMDEALSDN